MKPKIVKKEAVKLAGFVIKTTTKDGKNAKAIPMFWQEYLNDGRCEKLHKELFVKSHAEYGACFPENSENGDMKYVIGVEVKEGITIPEEYHICTLPEAEYAVFSTPPANEANFVSSIQDTWSYIYAEWLPNSEYEFDTSSIDFELYDERCMNETGKVIDIYIPVLKKQGIK